MARYNLEEDIEVYRENRAKCLNLVRTLLVVAFVIMYIFGEKAYEILLINAISGLMEKILNYKKLKYSEDLIAIIGLVMAIIGLFILTIAKYIE